MGDLKVMPVQGAQNEGISGEDAEQESKSRGSRLAQVIEFAEERARARKLLQAKQLASYKKDKKLATEAASVGTKFDKVV